MKYDDFKIFKFSTILKIIDPKRYNFSRVFKNIKFKRYNRILVHVVDSVILIIKYIFSAIYKSFNFISYNLSKIYKNINFKKYNFFKIYKYLDFRRYNLIRIYKYSDFNRYNFSKIYKYFDIKRYTYVPVYVAVIVVFSSLIYLSIPMFFTYDKSKFGNVVCEDLNIECLIRGKIGYSFLPSPRIKIKDLIIKDFVDKEKTFGRIDNVAIKLSFYRLYNKSKLNFTKIMLQNAEMNLDLHNLEKYKNFFKKKFNSRPINLKKGEIKFFDDTENIATIRNVNFKYKTNKNTTDAILKGDFLNDAIYINLKSKKNDKNPSAILILKLLDSKTKVNMSNLNLYKNTISGNISFKKGKNKITSTFDYKDNHIIFTQANLRNVFLDGKFNGEVKFLPHFNFNLDMDLNSINFNRLYSSLIALDEKSKKNLFKINKKINGRLNFSANKIFSKRTLIDSFESRIQFINGNISVEQLLLNLGKIGAADITGIINNDKKFSTFKFEINIFLDNLKRFYNKFGVFNKHNTSSSVFISGNLDLVNLKLRLNEISDDQKFTDEDVAYIEREFNDLLLEDGYASLFNFVKLKEFIKLITPKTN